MDLEHTYRNIFTVKEVDIIYEYDILISEILYKTILSKQGIKHSDYRISIYTTEMILHLSLRTIMSLQGTPSDNLYIVIYLEAQCHFICI